VSVTTVFPFSGLGTLNWVNSAATEENVLVRMHMATFLMFEFQNVLPHANYAKIQPRFQKHSKKPDGK